MGGVVGGLVLAALVVVAGLWFLRKRKIKETAEKGPWIPYATGSKPGYFAEVEGANTRMELPAPVGTEMPTEDSRMKKYQVHELHSSHPSVRFLIRLRSSFQPQPIAANSISHARQRARPYSDNKTS
ncbi:MAG: hypothetical protein Q9204_003850 [Flavoplaca sp. TL-2023a]